MNTTARAARVLAAVLLLGGALLSAAPTAFAMVPVSAAPQVESSDLLTAPVLTNATRQGDLVVLLWTPSASESQTRTYAVHANGRFVFRTAPPATSASVFLTSEGLTGKEQFTLVAEDRAGNQSAPSNGLMAVAPGVLPTPTLTSASFANGQITLKWTPSRTTDPTGWMQYIVYADGAPATTFYNTTSAQFSVVVDPITPKVLTGHEVFTIVARDRTMAQSPQSNALSPTVG